MKKNKRMKLALTGLLVFGGLFGCAQSEKIVSADNEKQFTRVSKEREFVIQKHNATGCYYLFSDSSTNYGIATQMLDKDGLPYCPGGDY